MIEAVLSAENSVIYLDYAASTPIDHCVATAMANYLQADNHANPSAPHYLGKLAKNIIEENRQHIANLIGADSSEIVWTSGATESNNLAIIGTALANQHVGNHIITLATEHESVLQSCQYLESKGFNLSFLALDIDGRIDLNTLKELSPQRTLLLSVSLINNEIGTIQDIKSIAEHCQTYGIIFHVDASQAAGKIPINVNEIPIDLMSLSAHKMYGPKGIGALYIRNQSHLNIHPILQGGKQENGMRAGTLATHQIIGFGEACKIAKNNMSADLQKAYQLRELFFAKIGDLAKANIPQQYASPYIFNIHFPQLTRETQKKLDQLTQVIFSAKSACSHHQKDKQSHVLTALGLAKEVIQNSYRFSIGRFTTPQQLANAIAILRETVLR